MSLEKVLIKDSFYSRKELKKRLYDEGIKIKQCEICGQDENWKGTKLIHILDHINGESHDNRLENLRIICPNCNSSLETSNGKNKRTKILTSCEDCGCNISKKSKKCINCRSISNRVVERPSIEDLLKEVNTYGYTSVGKKYGVSDNTIRKWIKFSIL